MINFADLQTYHFASELGVLEVTTATDVTVAITAADNTTLLSGRVSFAGFTLCLTSCATCGLTTVGRLCPSRNFITDDQNRPSFQTTRQLAFLPIALMKLTRIRNIRDMQVVRVSLPAVRRKP